MTGKGTRDTRKRPGRKRSIEQAALAAFQRAVTPSDLYKMTEELVAMFWRNADEEEVLEGGEVKIVRRATDPRIRYQIWERLTAYGIGEPTKRIESGKLGDLQAYLNELLGEGDAAAAAHGAADGGTQRAAPGTHEAAVERIAASWSGLAKETVPAAQ